MQYNQYDDNESNYPFPNRKKLVGIKLTKQQDPVVIQLEGDGDDEEVDSIPISYEHVTIVEYDRIEYHLMNESIFELS